MVISALLRLLAGCLPAVFALLLTLSPPVYGKTDNEPVPIPVWQFKWMGDSLADAESALRARDEPDGWSSADAALPLPDRPANGSAAWLKLELPRLPGADWKQPGLFIDKLYGHRVQIFVGERLIYESDRNYSYDTFKLALPLEQRDMGQSVHISVATLSDRIGIHQAATVGDYGTELLRFYKYDLFDMIFGGALVFFAAIMLVCSSFLNKSQLARWISLSAVILTTGLMIVAYSPVPYTFFAGYGKLYLILFDVSLFLFLPAFALFVEKALDGASSKMMTRLRIAVSAYSAFCAALLVLNELTGSRFIDIYYLFTLTVLGIVMIVQFSLLGGASILYALKGNKDAVILSAGFGLFALIAVGELLWFFARGKSYELHFWKWGVLCFVIAFIVILSRRFARDHEQIVHHSRELELYNNRLQRHEKMEIISELAASVAHEVRNPLQVTRGFLQLLRETSEPKAKTYLGYAMEELDRASGIITDFLTFAKPQLDDVRPLRLSDEFEHIQGILAPMAHLQGGDIRVHIPDDLYISGNSAKLKQAFVNIIKNSIEALDGAGTIEVWSYSDGGEIVIHVKDSGGGMDDNELSRLGEPYFSSKTKGTGLGLMVTFRIIEVMRGNIEFKSKKGVGTEAIVRFPQVQAQATDGE